jgi:ESS family glutamate:Na+ symporter
VSASAFLKTYNLPEPVVGGLLIAVLLLILHSVAQVQIRLDSTLQEPFMLVFFATIGLNANIARLKAGGRALLTFLGAVAGLLVLQNIIALGMAEMMGLNPFIGLLSGSIALSGGHGTGAAWSKIFSERYGLVGATEIAIACATFGLILGGLIGGPIAHFLSKRVTNPVSEDHPKEISAEATSSNFPSPNATPSITPQGFIEVLIWIVLSVFIGAFFSKQLGDTPFALPTFVCVLFAGVLLNNALSLLIGYKISEYALLLLNKVSLSFFLVLALVSLQLWNLATLLLPVLLILIIQTIVMAFYAVFVTFRVMGGNYDAVVLAAGHCGFGLGATPTALANMQAVVDRFGPSPLAFLVVPMAGAFFNDILNVMVIKLFLILPIYSS